MLKLVCVHCYDWVWPFDFQGVDRKKNIYIDVDFSENKSNLFLAMKKKKYPRLVLLTEIKPEYSDILYKSTHFPGLLVCQIRQVPLYLFLAHLDHIGQMHICDKITQSEIQYNIKLNYYSTFLYATVWPGSQIIYRNSQKMKNGRENMNTFLHCAWNKDI
jgi:hypothetical protein